MNQLLLYSTYPYTMLALIVAVLLLLMLVIRLYWRLSLFMRGEHGTNLESVVRTCIEHIGSLKKHDELISEHALRMDERLSQAVRNISVVRFRAFDQNASNQSFAIALVNEQGDGVVLSSLHNRDHMSVYAKPIQKYGSAYDLSEEESQVLEESKKAHTAAISR